MQTPIKQCAPAIALFVIASAAFAQDEIAIANQDHVITNGDLIVRDNQPKIRTRLDSASGDWFGFNADGRRVIHVDQGGANVFLGGNGTNDDGDLVLFSETSANQQTNNASIHLDGGQGAIRLGGGGETGQMVLRDRAGDQHILLDGGEGLAVVGNTGQRGRLELRNGGGTATAAIDGASGRIRANQIISRAVGRDSQGVDTASVFIESRDPSLGILDTSNGNQLGWYVQGTSTGRLMFQSGTSSAVGQTVFVLQPDGGVCLGNCD